jgi:2-C-methyl-D-erythritol 4-phosphate cytidylyltransferase
MNNDYRIGAVIVAAGSGLRFGDRKQFKNLKNKSLYLYSLEKFIQCKTISEISLVVPADLKSKIYNDVQLLYKNIYVVEGGKLRQDSVLEGVNALSEKCNIICVHDAARPFISTNIINNALKECTEHDGIVVAIPSRDTVKEVDKNNNLVKRTIPRETVWLAQTPQVFNREKLLQALAYAKTNQVVVTDEATLLESLGFSVAIVEGDIDNFKITTKADWTNAEIVLERKND